MFCPKCGNPVSSKDNYCAVCGKNLKNVKINIESLDKEETTKSLSSDETKVFKPISIDKIDSTDEIKKIIDEVDKKISKNIKDYEDKVNLKQENDKLENDDFLNESSFSKNMTQKELVKRVQEELKKSNFKEEDISSIDENFGYINEINDNKKKSLKEKWNNFINEDDDEFSIFSNLKKDKSEKTKIERDFDITQNTNTDFADDTYNSIPISQITEIIKDKEIENNLNENNAKSKKSIKNTIIKTSKKEKKLNNEFKTEREKLKKEFKNTKKEIESLEENMNSKSKKYANLYRMMDKITLYTSSLKNFVKDTNSKEFKLLAISIIILTIIQLFIGQDSFNIFQLIILVALKILFDVITFYVPLNITTDRAWISSSDEDVRTFSIINLFLCDVFLFIAFIFSPFGGLFKYNLISALTAMPFATVLLIFISTAIALSFYWKELRNKNKIEFLGWYVLIFVLLELGFKMFWFFINFIFNTLF